MLIKLQLVLPSKGIFTPKTRVFSAAEILLRIYQNPIHLNGARRRTKFWTHREVRRRNKTRNAAAKLHAWLDPWATANEHLVSNITVWLSAHDHILAYHGTSIPTASSVFLLRCECSGTDKTRRQKRAALVWIAPKGLFTPKTCVFSTADLCVTLEI